MDRDKLFLILMVYCVVAGTLAGWCYAHPSPILVCATVGVGLEALVCGMFWSRP